MLMLAVGARLQRLTEARAHGALTGSELERRIAMWQDIIHKLDDCLGDEE